MGAYFVGSLATFFILMLMTCDQGVLDLGHRCGTGLGCLCVLQVQDDHPGAPVELATELTVV